MRYTQPQNGPIALERGYPLAGGLVAFMPLTGKTYQDALDKATWTPAATATPVAYDAAPRGLGLRIKGATAAYVSRPLPAALSTSTTQPLTIRFRLYLHAATTTALMSWGSTQQDGAPRIYVRVNGSSQLNVYVSGYNYTQPLVVEREYIFTHAFDGVTHSTYLNGVLIGSFVKPWAGNTSTFYLGNGFDGLFSNSDFLLSDFALWNRALTPQEVAGDAQNPWQVVKAAQRMLAIPTAVIGTSGTFAATESPDTLAATGSLGLVPITGTLASTEGADTLVASGALGLIALTGTFAATEVPDTLVASGAAAFTGVSGSFASTETPDTAIGAGTVTWNPISGLFAATEAPDRLSAAGTAALPAITGTFAATEGADTLAGGNVATAQGMGMFGGAGSSREVRKFADALDKASKQTKSHKKQVRRALETEALALLPDEPAAKEIAPVLAALVAREQTPVLAAWQPVRALMPVALPYAAEAQLMALVQQWQAEREAAEWAANDEYETELLLLGAA